MWGLRATPRDAGRHHRTKIVLALDGQDRQSPIARDLGSQTQIAALFAILTYRTVELRISNRAFRIAIQIARVFGGHESRVFKLLAILDVNPMIKILAPDYGVTRELAAM